MYYDDEDRRINLIGGLVLGIAVGASVVLLARPVRGTELRPRLREAAGALRARYARDPDQRSESAAGRADRRPSRRLARR